MSSWKQIDEITFITIFDYYDYKETSNDGKTDYYESLCYRGKVVENTETRRNNYYVKSINQLKEVSK